MHLDPACSCRIPTKEMVISWYPSCNANRSIGKSYSIVSTVFYTSHHLELPIQSNPSHLEHHSATS